MHYLPSKISAFQRHNYASMASLLSRCHSSQSSHYPPVESYYKNASWRLILRVTISFIYLNLNLRSRHILLPYIHLTTLSTDDFSSARTKSFRTEVARAHGNADRLQISFRMDVDKLVQECEPGQNRLASG